MADWKTFEPLDAPGPKMGDRLRLGISQEMIDTNFLTMKLSPLFQVSAHLFGRLPDINLIEMVARANPTPELTTLKDAYACFQGIERPHDDENNGDSILVYVLRPKVTIEAHVSMTCQARAAIQPENTVLTALVRIDQALQKGGEKIDGYVTRLEWVFADADNRLPKNHEKRYNRRHW